jgi:8-oxo-dGDP phosphatase
VTVSAYQVTSREERFKGRAFGVMTDTVSMPGGRAAKRDIVTHVGSVGVVALDDQGRVVLVRQYRHPVGDYLWELPAGLMDVQGEPLEAAAARELAEEADLVASDWRLLADLHTTPGASNEVIRLFLARGLSPAPAGYVREDEEADMTVRRLPLDEAVDMIFRAEITNGPAVAGLLAAARLRDRGFPETRPLDSPLPPRLT